MNELLSFKQRYSIRESKGRLNIWCGAVRSGKSYACMIRFIRHVLSSPPGIFCVCGRTRDTVKMNVIYPLKEWLGDRILYKEGNGELYICDRLCFVVGANDERAETKIRGSTFLGALVDEITIIPENFFKMLLSRLSKDDAKLFGTTNPDSPFHWFKLQFLDRAVDLDLMLFNFNMDDNPSLSQKFKENLANEYQGLWRERYIDGRWVLAEGTIFDFFDKSKHTLEFPPGNADYFIVGVDYGTTNPTAFSMIGFAPHLYPNSWLQKEYYWDSKKQLRQKTDSEYAQDLKKFIEGHLVKAIYVDPSAVSFRAECARVGIANVYEAKNEVLSGIRYHSQLISNGTFKVMASCKSALEEYSTYRWDPRGMVRGEDKPLKENDHMMDSIRYALFSHGFLTSNQRLTPEQIDQMRMEAHGVPVSHGKFFDDKMW